MSTKKYKVYRKDNTVYEGYDPVKNLETVTSPVSRYFVILGGGRDDLEVAGVVKLDKNGGVAKLDIGKLNKASAGIIPAEAWMLPLLTTSPHPVPRPETRVREFIVPEGVRRVFTYAAYKKGALWGDPQYGISFREWSTTSGKGWCDAYEEIIGVRMGQEESRALEEAGLYFRRVDLREYESLQGDRENLIYFLNVEQNMSPHELRAACLKAAINNTLQPAKKEN